VCFLPLVEERNNIDGGLHLQKNSGGGGLLLQKGRRDYYFLLGASLGRSISPGKAFIRIIPRQVLEASIGVRIM